MLACGSLGTWRNQPEAYAPPGGVHGAWFADTELRDFGLSSGCSCALIVLYRDRIARMSPTAILARACANYTICVHLAHQQLSTAPLVAELVERGYVFPPKPCHQECVAEAKKQVSSQLQACKCKCK